MSGKNNLVNVPSEMSYAIPSVDSMYYQSVESLYNYIRFFAFSSVSDKRKKKLFLEAYNTPLKRPDIFLKFVEAVKADDFDLLEKVVQDNKVDVEKEVKQTVGDVIKVPDTWSLILDCYFAEEEPVTARKLLTKLIFFPIFDEEMASLKLFIKNYKKADDDVRYAMVDGYVNAQHI